MGVPESLADDYIDRLPPGTTMGFVFADFYGLGSFLADGLEERIRAAGKSGEVGEVPGTFLKVTHDTSADNELEEEVGKDTRQIVAGRLPTQYIDLLHLTQEGPAGEERSFLDTPVSISGLRNDSFPIPAYYIHKSADTIIYGIASLREKAAGKEHDSSYDHEQPYVGDTQVEEATKLAELDDHDRKRLRIVTNALELGIVRVELLSHGADFYEMFGLNKPPQPRRWFSLRGLLTD